MTLLFVAVNLVLKLPMDMDMDHLPVSYDTNQARTVFQSMEKNGVVHRMKSSSKVKKNQNRGIVTVSGY